MTIACPTVHSLLAHVIHANPTLIGIDGLDGCRKTTLAFELAGHTHYQVISLDKFLDTNKGAYVDHIDFDGLRRAAQRQNSIVEGVCLLEVLERVGLKLDLAIYVQRYRHGLWADEDWLGLDQNIEDYLEKLGIATELVSGEESERKEDLSTEIIRYHHEFHPHERADLTFSWNDS